MSFIGLEKLEQLRKDKTKFILLYLLPTLAFAGVVFLLFYFSSRGVMSIFPVILSILTTLYISYIFYLSFIPLARSIKYSKLCKEVARKSQVETDIEVLGISKLPHSLRGIRCVEVFLLDIELKQEMRRYIPLEYKDALKVGQKGKITAFHELICSFKEDK